MAFVPDCIRLFKRLLGDPRVPRRAKVALGLTLAYLALPFDRIPDFISVIGQLDDALLVGAMLRYVARSAGPDVVSELCARFRIRAESRACTVLKAAKVPRLGRGLDASSGCFRDHSLEGCTLPPPKTIWVISRKPHMGAASHARARTGGHAA